MFALGLLLVVGLSLATTPPAAHRIEGRVWRPSDAAVVPGTPRHRDYRWQSLALGPLTLAAVTWWW